MEFENGALRWIRCGEVELLRGIFFLARDRNWGTLASRLTDIDLHQSKRSFRLAFKAECHGALGRLAWSGTMTGTEDGCVQLLGIAHPGEDFETARTGFILLHPLERVVGTPVEIEHGDGTRSLSRFPEEIRSDPLWTSIRSLCYEPARQLRFRCVMEGDLWECEDQRNWGDASFKTYCRPTSLPSPYVVPAGAKIEQVVTLRLSERAAFRRRARRSLVSVALGGESGARMPQIGLSAGPTEAMPSHLQTLATLGAQWLSCRLDLRMPELDGRLKSCQAQAKVLGAALLLEILLSGTQDALAELQAVVTRVKRLGLRPEAVMLGVATDLWEAIPGRIAIDRPTLFATAREVFPGSSLGGGSYGSFYLLNRHRPPVDLIDFVTHSTSCVVHAADDRSIMETLQTLPHQIRSARRFCGELPYCLGPVNIGLEFNPDGEITPNPRRQRIPMVSDDPRHRSLFGAAWAAGYLAQAARLDVQRVTMGAMAGPFGVIDEDGIPYPMFHVIREFAAHAGHGVLVTDINAPDQVQAIACQSGPLRLVWLANLRDTPAKVRLSNLKGQARTMMLSLGRSPRRRPLGFETSEPVELSADIALDAFAVARIEFPA